MGKRRYSDEDKAQALALLDANGGNYSRAAREAGIPRLTLKEWAAGRGVSDAVLEVRQEKVADLAQQFDDFALRVLDLTTDSDIQAATLRDRFTAAGIAVDKARLLRGEPTQITERQGDGTRERFSALYVEVAAERTALVAPANDPAQQVPPGQAPDTPPTELPLADVP